MIILILVVLISIGVFCHRIGDKYTDGWQFNISAIGFVVSLVFAFILSLITVFVIFDYISYRTVDDKIAMYQKENKAIEEDIKYIVQNYQAHESDIYRDILDNPIALGIAFPEFKSNDLASKQIDLYVKNNNKIKSLKLNKIERENYKFWLFFG